jgi:Ribbon-helix-helix protein, copG family
MSHRFQLVLTHEQYSFLDAEADRSGVSVAELIRRAIDTTYDPLGDTRRVHVIRHDLGRRSGRRFTSDYDSPSK